MSTQQYPEHILKQADEMAIRVSINLENQIQSSNETQQDKLRIKADLISHTLNLPVLLMAKETSQREHDLVRQQRAELHRAELITDEEYHILASEFGAVQRLEDYDRIRAQLSQHQQVVKQLVEMLEEAKDMVDMLLVIPGVTRPAQEGSPAFKIESALSTAKQLLEKKV